MSTITCAVKDHRERAISGLLVLMSRMDFAPHHFRGYSNERGIVDVWKCEDQPEVPIGPVTADNQSFWRFAFHLRHHQNHPFPIAKVYLYIEEACMHHIIVRIHSDHFEVMEVRSPVQAEDRLILGSSPKLNSTQHNHETLLPSPTGHDLSTMGHDPPATGHDPPATGHDPPATDYSPERMPPAGSHSNSSVDGNVVKPEASRKRRYEGHEAQQTGRGLRRSSRQKGRR